MEPRSFDRGGCSSGPWPAGWIVSLQWSRGLSTAEGGRRWPAAVEARGASMEPRSFDRGGRAPVRLARREAPRASMEPRSFDRGGALPPPRPPLRPPASMEPRSFDRGGLVDPGVRVPQEAHASMEPRSFDRGGELDRGRRGRFQRRASMEPRSFDRGGEAPAPTASSVLFCFNGAAVFRPRRAEEEREIERLKIFVLQWSRGLSTAEGSRPPGP